MSGLCDGTASSVALFRIACACVVQDVRYPLTAHAHGQLTTLLGYARPSRDLEEVCWQIVLQWARERGVGTVPILEADYARWRQAASLEMSTLA